MQSRQHIHAHGHTGDKLALDGLRRRLPVFRRPSNGAEQSRLDEAEVQVGDPLRHADVRVVGGARMRGGSLGFNRTLNAMVLSLVSLM